mgnify:FL=1
MNTNFVYGVGKTIKYYANLCYVIAVQTGLPAIAWGDPGEAKSAYMKALAKAMGRKFYHFIPSIHLPEDLSGIPVHNKAEAFAKMVPLQFMAACQEPGWLFFFDEVTTTGPQMRPPLLGLLEEGAVGDIKWHPTTIRCAAANPPEWAPNGSPLEGALCNRMMHVQWQFPLQQWLTGMENNCQFEVTDELPIVDMDVVKDATLPFWSRRVSGYIRTNPSAVKLNRAPEEGELAYPSPRTWHKLAVTLAAAAQVHAPYEVYAEMGEGWVGKSAAAQFFQYVASCDRYNPAEIIDGTATPDYDEDRVDQLIHLPWVLVQELKSRSQQETLTDSGVTNAIECMINMAEAGLMDCVIGPMGDVTDVAPEYTMPTKLAGRFGKLVEQVAVGD